MSSSADTFERMLEELTPEQRQRVYAGAEQLRERQAIVDEARIAESLQADHYIERAPRFLAAVDPPLKYLLLELLVAGVLALFHGEPRTRKSWAALDIAIALATGSCAFGLERFKAPSPVPALYVSQEDVARDVRLRAKALLRGRSIDRYPDNLAFAVHRGIDLDSESWRKTLIEDVQHYGFKALILDPARRFSANVDKGPAEVRSLTAYLRSLVVETGATVMIVHHDVKPSANGPDQRRRGHRASGGDWFAAAECPVAFETAGDNCTVVYPESFKLSADPAPFTFRLETDDPRDPTVARLIGEDTTVENASDLAAQEKVLSYLTEHKGASGSAIAKGARIGKDTALDTLHQLEQAGKVDSVKADRKGKATTWFLTGKA